MEGIARPVAEWSMVTLEITGVCVIALLAAYALLHAVLQLWRRVDSATIFQQTRHRLGYGILLGLELLVAADIIRTAAIELSFHSVGVLAAIVAIRTFLSFTLEVELNGRWPWQDKDKTHSRHAPDPTHE